MVQKMVKNAKYGHFFHCPIVHNWLIKPAKILVTLFSISFCFIMRRIQNREPVERCQKLFFKSTDPKNESFSVLETFKKDIKIGRFRISASYIT
jgi:hypothetical protein